MKTWHEAMQGRGLDSYENYGGDTDHKDMLVFLGRNRDSDILQESNFTVALEALGGESETVQVHRFGHWACGWIELILIQPGTEGVQLADDMLLRIEDYPVLDEEHYSSMEYHKVMDYWESCSLRERMYLCRDFNISFLAARHDDLPMLDDELYQGLAE